MHFDAERIRRMRHLSPGPRIHQDYRFSRVSPREHGICFERTQIILAHKYTIYTCNDTARTDHAITLRQTDRRHHTNMYTQHKLETRMLFI